MERVGEEAEVRAGLNAALLILRAEAIAKG